MQRWKPAALAAAVAVIALHCAFAPRTLWEYDENFFAMGVEHYQPLLHHPPPPGAPLFIAAGKIAAIFTSDAFHALRAVNMLAIAAGFAAFLFAFMAIGGAWRVATVAAVLLYMSPSLLVSASLAQTDAGALALVGLAAWAFARDRTIVGALACAAAVGWRPQSAVMLVVMLLVAAAQQLTSDRAMRSGERTSRPLIVNPSGRDVRSPLRRVVAMLAAFGAGCLAWLLPLVHATGGSGGFWHWLSSQASDFAAHDAALSRAGLSTPYIALRFIAHPWGPKWLALPLLVLATLGAVLVLRWPSERRSKLLPLALGSIAYLAFAIATMDPADAVRYAIPALPLFALLAACAFQAPLTRPSGTLSPLPRGEGRYADASRTGERPGLRSAIAVALALAYSAGSLAYSYPVLHARATSDSPSTAAAEWIRVHMPRNTVVLYDSSLRPMADNLLRDFPLMPAAAGLARYGSDASTPLVVLADGDIGDSRGAGFRWPDTDALRKLTRGHYGAVSAVVLPPLERFRIVRGIYAPERTRAGESWHWLTKSAEIELPPVEAQTVALTFRLPPNAPIASNAVRVAAGSESRTIDIRRGASTTLAIPRSGRIRIDSALSFTPSAMTPNGDPRTLSVMLVSVRQR